MKHRCGLCHTSLVPSDIACAGCGSAVVLGATGNELLAATKLGVAAVLAVWCYIVAFSVPAVIAGIALAVFAGLVLRHASAHSRAGLVRTRHAGRLR